MALLDALEAEVARAKTVDASAKALIAGLAQKIIDAGTDKVKLDALVADLQASDQDLADAVVANTPAEPTP